MPAGKYGCADTTRMGTVELMDLMPSQTAWLVRKYANRLASCWANHHHIPSFHVIHGTGSSNFQHRRKPGSQMVSNVRSIIIIKCKLEHLRAQGRNSTQNATSHVQAMYMYSSVLNQLLRAGGAMSSKPG